MAAATTRRKHAAIVPTLAPSSRADLEQKRKGVVARGPSGAVYRLRQINLQRHALSGGLPAQLIQVAMEGQEAIGAMFEQMARGADGDADQAPIRDYLDNLVIASVIEPVLGKDDLGDPGKLDDDALVPAVDYEWIVSVAFRESDVDAEGRRLWGVEPFSRFQLFRDFHGCAADCEGCLGFQAAVSAAG